MKKLLYAAAVLAIALILRGPLLAQQLCSYAGAGLGTDIPQNVTVTTPYSGDPTKALISWTNNNLEYGAVQLTTQLYNVSSPDVDRIIPGPNTPSRSTQVVVDNLIPNSSALSLAIGFNIAVCPTGIPTWNLTGAGCHRNSTQVSLFPAGNGQANACLISTSPTTGSPVVWTSMPFAVQNVYAGHSINISVTNLLQSGSVSNVSYLVMTHIDIDGSNCTVGAGGGMCGSTEKFQFVCDNSEALNPATNNYDTFILQGGPYSGDYFCQGGFWSQSSEFLRVTGGSVGSHTVHYTLSAQNVTGSTWTTLGSSSASYTYTVKALPSPITPPSVTTQAAPVNNFDWLNAVETQNFFGQFYKANTTLPGIYLNDSASSTEYTYLPWAVATYAGDSVAIHLSDWYSTAAAFQPSQHYAIGQKFCSAGSGSGACATNPTCVLVATSAGTSSSSAPSCPAVGNTVTSGGATFTNVGNGEYWLQQVQRLQRQVRDQYLDLKDYYVIQEWAIFPWGTLMDCFREFTPSNCSTSLDEKALAYIAYPNLPGGSQTQGIIYDYVTTPMGDIRRLPYNIEDMASHWIITGNYPTLNGVDIWSAFTDVLVQTVDAVVLKNYYDGGNQWPVAMGMDYSNFDIGLLAEGLITAYDTEAYMSAHGWGGSPDTRIPAEVLRLLDNQYSTQWAVSGNFSFSYEPGLIPNNQQFYNNNQTNLNNLVAPGYLWLWRMYGDSAVLPTSGANIKTVALTINSHTWDNVQSGSGKEATQIGKWEFDFIHWLQGDYSPVDMGYFPDQNPYYGSTWPNTTEPYPDGSYPAAPLCTATSHTTASCLWYGHEQTSTCTAWFANDTGLSQNLQTFTGSAATFVSGTDSTYQCSMSITGISPPSSDVMFYAVGGPDAQGNVTREETAPYLGGQLFQITFPAGSGPVITTTSLPQGELTVAYSATINAANGVAPYSWSITAGTLPAGLSLTAGCTGLSCTITGTPTAAGTSSFTVQICDHNSNCGSKGLGITVQPLPLITTVALPNGQQGQLYSAVLMASGGIQPYTWSQPSGSLPPGLMLTSFNGRITGTPTSTGTYTATFQVTDVNGKFNQKALSITINGSGTLTILTTDLPDATQGVAYSQTLQASGGSGGYTWSLALGSGPLPPGLTLNSAGTISGTPTGLGIYPFTVQVQDSSLATATAPLSITVDPATLTITSPAQLPAGVVNVPYSYSLQATGGVGSYTWSIINGTLPTGLSLNSNGTIQGTPTVATSTAPLVQVTDSESDTAEEQMYISTIAPDCQQQ